MRPDAAAGREPRMCDAKTCDAITPANKYSEMRRKVFEGVTETILKLCEKVGSGTASRDEMTTLLDLIKVAVC